MNKAWQLAQWRPNGSNDHVDGLRRIVDVAPVPTIIANDFRIMNRVGHPDLLNSRGSTPFAVTATGHFAAPPDYFGENVR